MIFQYIMSSLSAAAGNDQMIFLLTNMRKQIYLPKNIHTHIQNNNSNKTNLLTNSLLYVAEQEEREFSIQDPENMVSNYLQTLK